MASRPFASSEYTTWKGALLRSWTGTSAVMVQPPLDHHYVVMHLGGPKRVARSHDGPTASAIAEPGSLTLVPAGTAYLWKTEGPIAFAHLYVPPSALEQIVEADGRAGRGVSLADHVGFRDPLLEPIFRTMLNAVMATTTPSTLLLDALHASFLLRLGRRHSSAPAGPCKPSQDALAPHRLRQVLDYIEAHLADDLALSDLAAVAVISPFHFCRAFHLATGLSPYRYLNQRRLETARVLLLTTSASLEEVRLACGFSSKRQFGVLFKKTMGSGPKRFRLRTRAA
ncbi:MAG: AraC family transcriptional regulator [Rubrivivax sp.]